MWSFVPSNRLQFTFITIYNTLHKLQMTYDCSFQMWTRVWIVGVDCGFVQNQQALMSVTISFKLHFAGPLGCQIGNWSFWKHGFVELSSVGVGKIAGSCLITTGRRLFVIKAHQWCFLYLHWLNICDINPTMNWDEHTTIVRSKHISFNG